MKQTSSHKPNNKVPVQKFLLLIAVASILAALVAPRFIFDAAILAALLAAAVIPGLYQRWIRMPIGIESLLFITIIAGIRYGAAAGFVFGAAAKILSDLANRTIGEWTPLNAFATGIGGFAAGMAGGTQGILITGLISIAAAETVRTVPQFIIGGIKERFTGGIYLLTHVIFNIWLLTSVAPMLGL